jgi:hypothetical protein
MKNIFTLLFFLFSIFTSFAQTFVLTVNNGYGSGTYSVGDTVHVWSVAIDSTHTFGQWTGDVQFLENQREWHTTLVMPSQNIQVEAQINLMPAYQISYELIMGKNNLKKVYFHFPANLKGVLYLFHGTGGSASNWTKFVEYRSFINAAIADTFGIIITEAEEITLNSDLNSDGKLRWQPFPLDTVNGIDYLNIMALTDTFINRNLLTPQTPKFSVGMSNGGSFSSAISSILNFKAGVSYCASGAQVINTVRSTPFAFRMAKFDDNEEVGPEGNYEAWQNDSILNQRGICHDYLLHNKQVLYPERFARIPGVSVATSQAIYNNLLNNNQIDNLGYAIYSETIKNNVQSNPGQYPSIISQNTSTQVEILNQISASNAEHKFYSDYNFQTLDFFNRLCTLPTNLSEFKKQGFTLFPNPCTTEITVSFFDQESAGKLEILNSLGEVVKSEKFGETTTKVNVENLSPGIYLLQLKTEGQEFPGIKFIKQPN